MTTQPYTISHTGAVLEDAGEESVFRHNNQIDPQRETEIIEFRCPTNFDRISWVGARDPVRFIPRTYELRDGVTGNTVSVDANLQPVAGEEEIEDQPYPVIEVVVNGDVAEVENVDYATNQITLVDAADNDDVHLFPIVRDGTLKMRGRNTLGQHTGPVFPWGFPLHSWHDKKQDKRGTEVKLNGSIRWERNEILEILVDSPTEIVWQHDQYPGSYVSELELDVNITF